MRTENNKEPKALSGKPLVSRKRSHKKKRVGKAVIIAILSVFVLVVGAGVYLINHYMDKINIIDPATESVLSPSEFKEDESKYWASMNDPNYTEPGGSTNEDPLETEEGVVKIV
ncbi:MAG: hypothetical protein IKI54_06055, partial [Lachnospiraceae bacterium]|nr:hypothetical protein [Lachnospiraceae bacterium]